MPQIYRAYASKAIWQRNLDYFDNLSESAKKNHALKVMLWLNTVADIAAQGYNVQIRLGRTRRGDKFCFGIREEVADGFCDYSVYSMSLWECLRDFDRKFEQWLKGEPDNFGKSPIDRPQHDTSAMEEEQEAQEF